MRMTSARSDEFLSVLESHKGIIYKVANAYAKEPETRKDLTQEIILQLWKAFDTYDPKFKHSTWIYKVSLNVSLAFSRKEHNRNKLLDPLIEDLTGLSMPDQSTDHEAEFRHLQRFIQELKALDRAILLLYLEDRSQKEMAEIIGITQTNVSTRIGRIKTTLREKFDQLKK